MSRNWLQSLREKGLIDVAVRSMKEAAQKVSGANASPVIWQKKSVLGSTTYFSENTTDGVRHLKVVGDEKEKINPATEISASDAQTRIRDSIWKNFQAQVLTNAQIKSGVEIQGDMIKPRLGTFPMIRFDQDNVPRFYRNADAIRENAGLTIGVNGAPGDVSLSDVTREMTAASTENLQGVQNRSAEILSQMQSARAKQPATPAIAPQLPPSSKSPLIQQPVETASQQATRETFKYYIEQARRETGQLRTPHDSSQPSVDLGQLRTDAEKLAVGMRQLNQDTSENFASRKLIVGQGGLAQQLNGSEENQNAQQTLSVVAEGKKILLKVDDKDSGQTTHLQITNRTDPQKGTISWNDARAVIEHHLENLQNNPSPPRPG